MNRAVKLFCELENVSNEVKSGAEAGPPSFRQVPKYRQGQVGYPKYPMPFAINTAQNTINTIPNNFDRTIDCIVRSLRTVTIGA